MGSCGTDPLVVRKPNVLIISIDTLRADRLGCYGYERDTSPVLDRFAAERAVRFANAIAESPWTLPSHVTLLSGLHPLRHGVRRPDDAIPMDLPLLSERLKQAGYYTFGGTDGGWLSAPWGFDRGFDSFEAEPETFDRVVARACDFMRFRSDKGPWFGFLHTYDVHCPYDPPEPYFSTFAAPQSEAIEVAGRCGNPHFNQLDLTEGQLRYLSDRYDGGVRWVDAALAELFACLDALELWENTIVVITSDHGEEFGEHGQVGHERSLHPELLRIPLLVHVPGFEAAVISTPVGLADVVPTLLELTGFASELVLDGRSLVALLDHRADPERESQRLSDLAWQSDLRSLWSPQEHVIWNMAREGVEAHGESVSPARLAELREGLESPAAVRGPRFSPPNVASSELDLQTLEALRSLGYAELETDD